MSPRIYGSSFFNNKDVVFLSLVTIALFYCFVMFTWIIIGQCILVEITNYLGGINYKGNLFPVPTPAAYCLCSTFTLLSLLFFIFPKISPYNLLTIIDKYSKK